MLTMRILGEHLVSVAIGSQSYDITVFASGACFWAQNNRQSLAK
jgi:hypothetical protein